MSYSLNVPVPAAVARLAADLRPRLTGFDRVRERHTLLLKRLPEPEAPERAAPHRLRERLRPALAGEPAFEARVAGVDSFERPARGPGPVVYLAVESPPLRALHRRLVDRFGAVEGLEGPDYVPHVTLARGGPPDAVERLAGAVEPVTWTVSGLELYSRARREPTARLSLSG